MKKIKKISCIAAIVIFLLSVFAGGAFFGYYNKPEIEKINNLFNKETTNPSESEIDFSPLWSAWRAVESKYVSSNKLDHQKMVWGAIEGMVKSLDDPYSMFFPPEEAKMFNEDINGDFEGVGMEIGARKGILIVIAPLKNTPADKAGIKAGDKILKINDTLSAEMTANEAVRLIRGPKGTSVKLTILRDGVENPLEISIIRDIIHIPALDIERKAGGIFVIKMYNFSGTAANSFRNALREFVLSKENKLILDLRNNPGGYLESAVDIASWFLPIGKVVVREKFSDEKENVFRSKGYNIFKNLTMVIIVNKGSASASEILAGALQEHGKAKLVGEKTFGKGSVQELIQITPETSLKLTTAQWLTPNGRLLSEKGLEPDIKVELTEEDFELNRDPQMDKAVEILSK
jgi:carboxyl-terminal processing protease